jgi:hypothetical protein
MSQRCSVKNTKGKRCGAWAVIEGDKCALHSDPERAARMGSQRGRRTALASSPAAAPMEPPKTAGYVRDALANTMAQVHARKMDTKTANALAYVATILLRAIEVADWESRLEALEVRHQTWERAYLQSSRLATQGQGGG